MKSKFNAVNIIGAIVVIALIALAALVGPTPKALAVGPGSSQYFTTVPVGSDPCQNPSVLKQSAAISISSATTTNIVTAVTGSYVTVCKWQFSSTGTTATVTWEYGTDVSTACDTGTTALTGAELYATAGIQVNASTDGLTLRTPISQELCILSAGSPNLQGYLTYVQQPY